MSGYILAVAGAVLLSAAFSVLLPGGKMGTFLKGICRLFVFAVLVSPLLSFLTKKELSLPQETLGEDAGYLAECARLLSERDGEEIAAYLGETYSLDAAAFVERGAEGGFPLLKITVNLAADGIIGQDEHINTADCIRAALSKRYACGEELIQVIWEG